MEILLGLVAASLGTTGKTLAVVIEETAHQAEEIRTLKAEKKQLARELSVHESWNHSSRGAVLFNPEAKSLQK